jgi:amino-acid N-acetyltransferase
MLLTSGRRHPLAASDRGRQCADATGPNGLVIRAATERDQAAIRALVRSERLNPTGLHWRNFLVAVDGDGLAGAVQMRKHADGSRELGSLVVAARRRRQGIAARLIDTLLASERASVHMVTGAAHAAHYRRWGFRAIEPEQAPRSVRFNYRMGQLACVVSFLKRRDRRQLVILERACRAVLRAEEEAKAA